MRMEAGGVQWRECACRAVQVKRKGRSVHVEPVPGINAERLRQLVQALLLLQQDQSAGGASEAPAARSPGSPDSSAAKDGDKAASGGDGATGGDECTPMQTVRMLCVACAMLRLRFAGLRCPVSLLWTGAELPVTGIGCSTS